MRRLCKEHTNAEKKPSYTRIVERKKRERERWVVELKRSEADESSERGVVEEDFIVKKKYCVFLLQFHFPLS